MRMDRSALMKEKRSRLLQAIRQTYNDFFHNYFITGDHCFRLRVCPPLSNIRRLSDVTVGCNRNTNVAHLRRASFHGVCFRCSHYQTCPTL